MIALFFCPSPAAITTFAYLCVAVRIPLPDSILERCGSFKLVCGSVE